MVKKHASPKLKQRAYMDSKKWDAVEWIENWDNRYPAPS